eukprot:NODE_2812_length_1035_cov_4.545639_g2353_i0.p9 GENE.NODE_2812_length_1035_cov_4.545639_g2353_i0~~NODE_2812_length_1035_cov_4.545639_g2353_i0.p9  ORF type:complete len:53 (+),score=1.55 NODE_2812_length_1035_cov_4.545639_g2353_i0:758-916(+)
MSPPAPTRQVRLHVWRAIGRTDGLDQRSTVSNQEAEPQIQLFEAEAGVLLDQ